MHGGSLALSLAHSTHSVNVNSHLRCFRLGPRPHGVRRSKRALLNVGKPQALVLGALLFPPGYLIWAQDVTYKAMTILDLLWNTQLVYLTDRLTLELAVSNSTVA